MTKMYQATILGGHSNVSMQLFTNWFLWFCEGFGMYNELHATFGSHKNIWGLDQRIKSSPREYG